jgi:hypothetical protein
MKNSVRIAGIVLVMVCFILTATNAMLILHLIEHHKDECHNPEHCPICQQAVINIAKAVLPDTPVIKEPPRVTIADVCVIQSFVKDFKFITPHMRAPPAAV